MKFTKFIPLLALSMLFSVPAFAEYEATEMSTTLGFTIDDFFRIERGTEVTTAGAHPNDTYTTLGLDAALKANYIVYSNKAADDGITITATCPHSGTDANAFVGTAKNAFYILFANSSAETAPNDAAISGAKNPAVGKAGSDNPDVIKLKITPVVMKQANSAYGVASNTEVNGTFANNAKYTFANGRYDCSFTCAQEAEANTFSTADTAGTYQATITITRGTT